MRACFLLAISELRMGKCSPSSQDFIASLERNLPCEVDKVATHIFFCKMNAYLFNQQEI
jgi:hypothetical protein